jgi:hypothetical protein
MVFYEKEHARHNMKYWDISADNLSKAGWSWGCVATVDREGRTSGLLTRIATTIGALLCAQMNS